LFILLSSMALIISSVASTLAYLIISFFLFELFFLFIYFYCLYIYSYVFTLFGSFLPPAPLRLPPLLSRPNVFCPLLKLCWRENIRGNKKDIAFLLAWDKDSYKRES
jgi:hypothetical protein